ncbi:hypothetical protein [Nocardioides sp. LML1-1-1.1]|uniref:hypothetical protein n=1 Tax=Nocardioides sp. LML1-1-1.1 TaxID=3135248 RepID=UPI00341793A9
MTRRVLAAALAVTALVAGGCSDDGYVAPTPVERTEIADSGIAGATVSTLQDALADPAAAAALGADDDAASLLAALARNVAQLRLSDVTLRYVTETGRTSGSDSWDGLVALTWRVSGFDEASSRAEVPFTFTDGGRKIAAIGGETGRLPLWLTGPVVVRRSAGVLVLATGAAADADRFARRAQRAVTAARGVLGGDERLVVEVPADPAQLGRALDADQATYAAIAAVTAPVDGTRVAGSPVHVFVNRSVYDALDPVAAQVVMTHEAVHAVTGAVLAQGAPLWLVEGFADYVALRDVDLPVSRTAAQVIAQVKREGVPERLPAESDFDPAASHLGTVYEAAWLLCVILAEHRDEAALVAFYRSVLGGTKVASALRASFGWSEADLTAAWRSRLASLAGVPE